MATFPEPVDDVGDRGQVLLRYLDFYRSTVAEKVGDLDEGDLRASRLPSGWSPLELVRHLVHMERRWLVWGFLAEQVDHPWGDAGDAGRWALAAADTRESLLAALRAGGRRTREIVEGASLADVADTGGRFDNDAEAPQLERILLHVLQEYARHCGHLDVARELVDGAVGE